MKLFTFALAYFFHLFQANALDPLPPEAMAAIIKHQSTKVQRSLLSSEENAKMKERGLIEGEIVWSARYKQADESSNFVFLTLVKKGTQKHMLGLFRQLDYAEALELSRTNRVSDLHYTKLKDGKAFIVYPGGVGPGRNTLCTMININDEFDLIIGSSDQSQWAKRDGNFAGRFIDMVGAINRYYAK
jgi:hypothetical protein